MLIVKKLTRLWVRVRVVSHNESLSQKKKNLL